MKMSGKDKTPSPHHSMKWIFVVILWLLALYAALLIVRNTEKNPESPQLASRPPVVLPVKHKGVCKSPECITLAHQLHNWRDISVDPCQDFYKAACGKYNEHTLVNGPRFSKKTRILIQLVGEFLSQKSSFTSKSENAMKVFFDKCEEGQKMNETTLDLEGQRDILEIMKQLGSWPMLTENWDESEFDLNDALSNMARIGITDFGFFKIQKNPLRIDFQTGKGNIEKDDVEKTLVEFLKFNEIQTDLNSTQDDVEELITFLNELETLASIPVDNPLYTIGFDKIQEKFPIINFEKILRNLMNEKHEEFIWNEVKTRIYFPSNHPFIYNQSKSLESILTMTEKRTLANFLFYQILLTRKVTEIFYVGETGYHCAALVRQSFPVAALRVYARNYYDKENLKEASDMVDDFQESLIETFLDSTWLHDSTKMRAIRKVELMKKVIGYPMEMEVPGALDSFYESLNLSPTDSSLSTVLKTMKFKMEQYLDWAAGFNPFPKGFHDDYTEAGAYYSSTRNELTLPVPFIDDPFFDTTFPKYAKVASIGAVIGHEMGHGFDVTGRKMDEKGETNDWWTPEDSTEYDRRTQCLIDRFNNYDDPDFGRKLNGSTTIKEHASDIIGVQISLRSYNKVDFANEPSIFGFEDERPDKLFFHLTALNWCRQREQTPLDLQLTRVHPTSSFRVNGIFSNMKEFAEAFSCPVGSPMNPEKKCELF